MLGTVTIGLYFKTVFPDLFFVGGTHKFNFSISKNGELWELLQARKIW